MSFSKLNDARTPIISLKRYKHHQAMDKKISQSAPFRQLNVITQMKVPKNMRGE
jgi:hypothetical protein